MKEALLALALVFLPQAAQAAPPATGSTHTFVDPVFTGTVFCDTYFEVLAIATADDPVKVYEEFLLTRNEYSEPRCAAVVPTALVLNVTPLSPMWRDGQLFAAWAVEVQVGERTGYALYLEQLIIA
jgi:hypothetical protein